MSLIFSSTFSSFQDMKCIAGKVMYKKGDSNLEGTIISQASYGFDGILRDHCKA